MRPHVPRRDFIAGALAAVTLAPRGAGGQPVKLARVGYLSLVAAETDRSWVSAFREGMVQLGYREGDNLVLEQRHAGHQAGRLRELAAELVRLGVEVVVANGTPAIEAARDAKRGLPVVMTVNADPVAAGLVASLARPGGSVTGNTDGHADLGPKRLQLLKAAVPAVSRVAVLWNPATPQAARQFDNIVGAAPDIGVTLLPMKIGAPDQIDRVFDDVGKRRADAFFVIPDQSWSQGQEARIAALALKNRLPGSGTVREFAAHGILMSYGANFHHLWRQAAGYVDKILKGTKPADLPVEHPTQFELVVNLRTARALGLTIPASLLLRADHVIP